MKKVSAFSVFKSKKEGDDLNSSKASKKSTVKKASSTLTINEIDKKSKKILNAFRRGSFRGTIKGSKQNARHLPSGSGESPFVAGDMGQVKLTGVKRKRMKDMATETETLAKKDKAQLPETPLSPAQKTDERQPLAPTSLCQVCADPNSRAWRRNGVHICEKCWHFYQRSMTVEREYVCEADKNCTVSSQLKDYCKACRLQRCFHVGMPTRAESLSGEANENPYNRQKCVSPTLSSCQVCGDAAFRSHFGKNICEACKDFFYKAIRKGRETKCQGNGNCEIKKETRKHCSYCRFNKCLSIGMKRKGYVSPGRTSDGESTSPVANQTREEDSWDQLSVRNIKEDEDEKESPHENTPRTSKSKRRRVELEKPAPQQVLVKQEEMSKAVHPPFSPRGMIHAYMYDSNLEAEKLFECMIHPVHTEKFFNELWQKKPLLVRRHMANYNNGWFSTKELDEILRKEHLEFGVNLDVTTYKDGKRETHNPVGKAYAPVVWDFYQTGCSIRLLNPQTYSHEVWKMLSVLQEYFNCCVGANVYLTPPGTQGFAPHYDDIEAFILQLEGKKHWKLYNPRNESEVLPRTSSPNFTEEDIGEPILDVTLYAGDLLYMPRGIIHQGSTSDEAHSLHITFSCFQKNTWGDLLEKLVPAALQIAIQEDVEFRQGLPRDYLNYMGIAHSDENRSERGEFFKKMTNLVCKMVEQYCPVDSACDQMGKQFLHDALPPVLTDAEKSCSIHGHGESWDAKNYCVLGTSEIEPDTEVKIIRKGVLRLVSEEDAVRIYHCLENERLYHAKDPQFIEISAEAAPAVEFLIHAYPEYVTVDSLPCGATVTEKVEIASILYDKGLLITKEPLDLNQDDNEDPEDDGH